MAKNRNRETKFEDSQATQQCISTGLFVRSLALARLAFSTSGELWNFKLGKSGSSGLGADLDCPPEQRARLQEKLEHEAREIARELGTLKGSVMKVGQLLSMYGEHFLPPQVNNILKSLQANTTPLDWETIEPFVRNELKSRYEELEINPRAIAAASIGQVHAAKIKSTGETIALKIQYPGVDRAISSDLKALKAIVMFAPGIPRGKRMNELVCEIEEMLWREVDYAAEADCGEKFGQHLKLDHRFLVPKVRREYCSSKVLAVDMICGHRLDAPELRSLSQARRDALADSLLELYLQELFVFGCVQTDPHIGNYRVRLKGEMACDGKQIENDCIVLLDFGAVRNFEESFLTNYRRLITATISQKPDEVRQAALDLGFLLPCDPPAVNGAFYDFCRLVVEPFDPEGASHDGRKFFDTEGRYDWSNNNLPSRLATQLTEIIRARELRAPPREAIFLDRKSSGLYILLSTLGAKTNAHERLTEALRAPN
jgi:predicted unusual protein kinase regulating ubiquinone biosynthesis (AarF/ABC1/UbiB family)